MSCEENTVGADMTVQKGKGGRESWERARTPFSMSRAAQGRFGGFRFNVGGCAVNRRADSVEDGVSFGMTNQDDPP